MRRCVCPGSYDPVTSGHLDVVARATALCDEVVVAVLHNPDKQGAFPVEERVRLLEAGLREVGVDAAAVRVEAFANRLLVDVCRDVDAAAVVKGLRSSADFEYEPADGADEPAPDGHRDPVRARRPPLRARVEQPGQAGQRLRWRRHRPGAGRRAPGARRPAARLTPDERTRVDVHDKLDEITALVEDARAVPMSASAIVHRADLLALLDEPARACCPRSPRTPTPCSPTARPSSTRDGSRPSGCCSTPRPSTTGSSRRPRSSPPPAPAPPTCSSRPRSRPPACSPTPTTTSTARLADFEVTLDKARPAGAPRPRAPRRARHRPAPPRRRRGRPRVLTGPSWRGGTLRHLERHGGTLRRHERHGGTLHHHRRHGGTLRRRERHGGTLRHHGRHGGTLRRRERHGGTLRRRRWGARGASWGEGAASGIVGRRSGRGLPRPCQSVTTGSRRSRSLSTRVARSCSMCTSRVVDRAR
nr:adenylyltransferase/cytidyltransferase family protein [Angustibacter aerolatus]